MRFVLPYHQEMRFDSETPTSKLLTLFFPWMKGRRPAWLIRLGLFLYDHLGGRKILPGTKTLDLGSGPEGQPLRDKFSKAYEYSDCWIEDSRLVVLNARDAQARGATIMTRTKVVSAERNDGEWIVTLLSGGGEKKIRANMLVNAGGPWVGDIIQNTVRSNSQDGVRLVRGSHIVTKKLFDHDKSYFFQGTDGRIIFAIPYEADFTLIGTTDMDHKSPDIEPECTPEEQTYLIRCASQYFKHQLKDRDIVWTYSGVRPLFDDGSKSATAATRDYVLKVDVTGGAPLLNVFGGKITTYRKLAESALEEIEAYLVTKNGPWTAGVALPGGDFAVDGFDHECAKIEEIYPFLGSKWARRLVRAYGTEAQDILGNAVDADDLGEAFGATITARELDWAIEKEWVRSADDFLWRRTKLGLRVTEDEVSRIEAYISSRLEGLVLDERT